MKQVILSSTVTSPAGSGYHCNPSASTSAGWTATTPGEASKYYVYTDTTFQNLSIDLRTAPGAGTSRTFEVYKNNASTGLSVTVSGTNTQGSNGDATVKCSAGDYITIYATNSGSPAAFTRGSFSLLANSVNKIYVISAGYSTATSNAARRFQYPFGLSGLNWSTGDSSAVRIYFSHSATIRKFYFSGTTAPGAGKNFIYSLYKNGVEVAASQITVADAATSGNVTGLSISLVATDYISFSSLPSGTPTLPGETNIYIEIEPDVEGESLLSASPQSVSATLPTWYRPIFPGQSGSTSSEINSRLIVPVNTEFYCKYFRALCGAPGVGKSRTFTVRLNEADVTNAVTVSGAATTGSDLTSIDKFTSMSWISSQAVASGSPTASNCAHYCTMYVPPDPKILFID